MILVGVRRGDEGSACPVRDPELAQPMIALLEGIFRVQTTSGPELVVSSDGGGVVSQRGPTVDVG